MGGYLYYAFHLFQKKKDQFFSSIYILQKKWDNFCLIFYIYACGFLFLIYVCECVYMCVNVYLVQIISEVNQTSKYLIVN